MSGGLRGAVGGGQGGEADGEAEVGEREERGEGLEGRAGEVGRRELREERGGDGTRGRAVLGDERQQVAQLGGAENSHSLGGPDHAPRDDGGAGRKGGKT